MGQASALHRRGHLQDPRRRGVARGGTLDDAFLTPEGELRLKNEKTPVISEGPRVFLYLFSFNMERKPWSDVRARQAISPACDRDEMIDKALSGSGTITGPIATGFGNYFVPVDTLKARYKVDLDKARQLLRDAGVPQGQELDLLVTNFGGSFYEKAAVVLKDQMQKIGIDVKIRQVEQGVFI